MITLAATQASPARQDSIIPMSVMSGSCSNLDLTSQNANSIWIEIDVTGQLYDAGATLEGFVTANPIPMTVQ